MKKGLIVSLCLLVVLPLTAVQNTVFAQSDWNLVSQVGGASQAIAVDGTNLFLGVGWHVEAFDISNPEEMVFLGSSEIFPDSIEDLYIHDAASLYAACGSGGLQIMDISDPSDPALVGSYDTLGYSEGVLVMGNYAIVADGPNGVQIFDVAETSNPRWVSEAYPLAYVYDVEVSGTTIFAAAGGSGILVIDVSDPENPQEMGLLPMSGFVYELAISDDRLYSANSWGGAGIVDISDPLNPQVIDTLVTDGWVMSINLDGTDLLVTDGANGVRLYDASSQFPRLRGIYEDTGFALKGVLKDKTAYVADKQHGLMVLDFSSPKTPQLTTRYLPMLDARRVTMTGSTAYVAAGLSGMRVIDLSNPAQPQETYWFNTENAYANKVITAGNTAYLTNHLDSNYPLRIFDISDVLHPQKIKDASYDVEQVFGTAFRSIAMVDDFLYVAAEYADIAIDVHDPMDPSITSALPHENTNVAAFGNLVAVVNSRDIAIYSIADPATLQLMNLIERDSGGEGVAFLDQNTLVVSYDDRVWVFDVSDPSSPAKRSEIAIPGGAASEIFITDNTAYIACLGNGILIVDLSDPDQPQTIGQVDTHAIATDCYVQGDLMLVAGNDSGLLVFQRGSHASNNVESSPSIAKVQPAGLEWMPADTTDPQSLALHAADQQSAILGVDYSMQTATSCVVTTDADDGVGSFRECLSNIQAGTTITFDEQAFPASKPSTIFVLTQLPEVNVDGITIDASNAGVIVDGSQQDSGIGLQIFGSNSKIMGLQIINFTDQGIRLDGTNNQLGGNRLNGSAPTGEGNLISGNWNNGIYLGGKNNHVFGNLIGTDVSGTKSFPNNVGLFVSEFCEKCYIGSSAPGEGNVISGNNYSNITTWGEGVIIQGNILGLDINGKTAIKPDTCSNILIESGGTNTLVGGTEPGERNIISGADMGVGFSDWPSYQNSVVGNYIGTDITGTKAVPNRSGATIFVVSYSRIGGTEEGEANFISGNQYGISLNGYGASDNIILANYLGYDANGNANLPNGTGINIDTGQKHTIIGGYTPAEGNLINSTEFAFRISGLGITRTYIAGNTILNKGINISGYSSGNFIQGNVFSDIDADAIMIDRGTGNLIRMNQFIMQMKYAITLAEGGNLELPAPMLNTASSYHVDGSACSNCYIEIYAITDGTATSIGKTRADADGIFLFESCEPLAGDEILSLSIDTDGNTSVFSESVPLLADDTERPAACSASTEP